ncbi:MAG: Gfo/Idh/MocA family oxidoreductase [Nostoc sp. DedQUE11]|nr:Gfo/Idh/MocA family oxidoreductase [Nostoc sp. DedQUE11]
MEIIKTALCSYGLSGKVFHAPFINLHPGFELIGSWERSKKLIQEDYPDVKSYSSLEALHLFGMPNAVFADMRITRAASQIDDYFELILYYEKLRVKLKASFLVREPVPSYIIHGTKGSFLKSRADAQEDKLRAGMKPNTYDWYTEPESEYGLLHAEKDGKVIREKVKSSQGSYLGYYDAMYQSIVHGQPIPVTAEDGINVMQIIEAAIKSSNEQKVIAV